MTNKKPAAKTVRPPPCPECGATDAVPVVHGIPSRAAQQLIELGKAVRADREEWEGLAEWRCKRCGCDWNRHWRRFKKSGGVNATHSD